MLRPSAFMRHRASVLMADEIVLDRVTTAPDPDPATGQPVETITYTWSGRALIRHAAAVRSANPVRVLSVRDLRVWVDDDCRPLAGDRVTIVWTAGDVSMHGAQGTVTDVDRDPMRACRRMTVRLTDA